MQTLSQNHANTDPWWWWYVATAENPADYVSRGLEPKDTEKWETFLKGPKHLWEKEENWKETETPDTLNDVAIGAINIEEVGEVIKKPETIALQAARENRGWKEQRRAVAMLAECFRTWREKRKGNKEAKIEITDSLTRN